LFLGPSCSFEGHQIGGQRFGHSHGGQFANGIRPEVRHLGTVRPKAIDGAQGSVAQLKGVLVLGVIADMGIPSIQRAHFARFPLEVAALAAFEGLWWEVHQRVGPDLQPVSLPRGHCWLPSLLLDRFPADTALHSSCCLRGHQIAIAAGKITQDSLGTFQGCKISLGQGVAMLQYRIIQQMMAWLNLAGVKLQVQVVRMSVDVVVWRNLAKNAAMEQHGLVNYFLDEVLNHASQTNEIAKRQTRMNCVLYL